MLAPTSNGNKYRSNWDGSQSAVPYKRARATTQKSKYLKFQDMALTPVQRKQVNKLADRKAKFYSEVKYKDSTLQLGTTSQNWILTDLSGTSGNTNDAGGRVGDNAYIRNLEMRWTARLPAGYVTNGGAQAVRMVIYQFYSDSSLSVPTATTIFQDSGTALSYISPFAHDTHASYNILYDETVCLSISGPDETTRQVVVYPKRKRIDYVGTGMLGKNHIFCAYVTDYGGSFPAQLDFWARFNYTDA